MPFLQPQDQQTVKERFETELKQDVNITMFGYDSVGGLFIPGRECETCRPTKLLLEEVSELSPKIKLEVIDYYANSEQAKEHGVDKIPAIIISGDSTDNVKYYGMPSGHEFAVLLDTLISTSQEETILQPETVEQIRALKEDVHIQVFVTPN